MPLSIELFLCKIFPFASLCQVVEIISTPLQTRNSETNKLSLSEDTSILLRQILEVQQQQAMLVQQQQAMPASQLQAQTLQETGTEIQVVTSNRNETQHKKPA